MSRPRIKKNDYISESNCFVCKKPSTYKERADPKKDFICSSCTMVLAQHPRMEGQHWDSLLPEKKKEIDPNLQKELSDILKI